MKTKFILICVALFITAMLHAQKSQKFFDKLSKDDNISSVLITKSLLQMGGKSQIGSINTKEIIDKLDRIEVYNLEQKKDSKKDVKTGSSSTVEKKNIVLNIKQELDDLLKDKDYELIMNVIMNVKDGRQDVRFIMRKDKVDTQVINELIMFVEQASGDLNIIRMLGAFTMEDIGKIVPGTK